MKGKIVVGILVALAIIAGAAGVGAASYRAGFAQGVAQSDTIAELLQNGGGPGEGFGLRGGFMPYGRHSGAFFGHHPFGFGFGFLGCLAPLLFLFLAFSLVRGFMWRRHWGWGMHGGGNGPWGNRDGAPPMFEEWHRRAHGEGGEKPQEPAAPKS